MARPMIRKGGKKKKKKNRNPNKTGGPLPGGDPNAEKIPRSMVFHRGNIGRTLRRLEQDLRNVMMPHTAAKLKESKKNNMKDFLQVAGPLGVTHFLLMSASTIAPYLRFARTPRGPTLTFKICQYSLAADVANAQAKPRVPPGIFESAPLLVMHGFGAAEGPGKSTHQHLKLVSIMFQNMFPAIDVSTVKLNECKRVLLLSNNPETKCIELRHYCIRARPTGVSRSLRKLVQSHKVPDLSAFADVSEFVARGGYGSESEAEEEAAHVRLAQDLGRGNRASQQSAVQLFELGPRVTLELVKVEEGLMSGEVMFHKYVQKSAEEIAAQKREREAKEALKRKRKEEQEANVKRKQAEKQKTKEMSMGKRRKVTKEGSEEGESGESEGEEAKEEAKEDEEDDDAEWYRQEVGEEPDQAAFSKPRPMRKRGAGFSGRKVFQKRRNLPG